VPPIHRPVENPADVTRIRPMERQKARILLVDDEESDLVAAREALQSDGHTVSVAGDFQDALDAFEAARGAVDLLIIDISLPGGNGCDLVMAIWKQQANVPVLFVSGHVGAEVCRYYGLDVSDRHFLRKPFSPAELKDSVRHVLQSTEPLPTLYPVKVWTSSSNP
jgi:DNA-binding response OmpR family regulator